MTRKVADELFTYRDGGIAVFQTLAVVALVSAVAFGITVRPRPEVSVQVNPVQVGKQSVPGDWTTEKIRRDIEEELTKAGAKVIGTYDAGYHHPGTYRVVVDLKVRVVRMGSLADQEQIDVVVKVWYKSHEEGTVIELYDSFAVWRGRRMTAKNVWRQILARGFKEIYKEAIEAHWRKRNA